MSCDFTKPEFANLTDDQHAELYLSTKAERAAFLEKMREAIVTKDSDILIQAKELEVTYLHSFYNQLRELLNRPSEVKAEKPHIQGFARHA